MFSVNFFPHHFWVSERLIWYFSLFITFSTFLIKKKSLWSLFKISFKEKLQVFLFYSENWESLKYILVGNANPRKKKMSTFLPLVFEKYFKLWQNSIYVVSNIKFKLTWINFTNLRHLIAAVVILYKYRRISLLNLFI